MPHHHSMSMHKLHFDGNVMGVVLAIGVVLLIALSLLSVQWFLLGAVVLGAGMCVLLFKWRSQHKLKFNDLSMLEDLTEKTKKT